MTTIISEWSLAYSVYLLNIHFSSSTEVFDTPVLYIECQYNVHLYNI